MLTACGPQVATMPPATPLAEPVPATALAEPDDYQPSYGKPEVERALITERGIEAALETKVAQMQANIDAQLDRVVAQTLDDQLRAATADLGVRRQFIAMLEACERDGQLCPPRLDEPAWKFDADSDSADPPLDAALRFDLADWQRIAAELHGRACAGRTQACIDSMGVAIDRLETRPMHDVQGDETASASITRARQCLFRLRGRAGRVIVRSAAGDDAAP
jgi:hypothetical protein